MNDTYIDEICFAMVPRDICQTCVGCMHYFTSSMPYHQLLYVIHNLIYSNII